MLVTKELSYQIKGKWLLSGVTLRTEPGELLAVLGPNGAGKSTLIRLISGEWPTQQGEIRWLGDDLTRLRTDELARLRAVLTQKVHMSHAFPAREVVLMGRYPHFKRQPSAEDWAMVDACMDRTETWDFADRNYQTLSGGEQQRVQLARALAQVSQAGGPFLLLLDEPLNNLDIRHQHALMQEAQRFARQGHVVLLVMHDLNLAARFADRILLLKAGRQQALGPPHQVLTEAHLTHTYDFPMQVMAHPTQGFPVVHLQ